MKIVALGQINSFRGGSLYLATSAVYVSGVSVFRHHTPVPVPDAGEGTRRGRVMSGILGLGIFRVCHSGGLESCHSRLSTFNSCMLVV